MGRPLPWILALAMALHAIDIGQSLLPAQDGLKFLRVARDFHHQPWADVVRASDQHPLYPAAVACLQPVLQVPMGSGPESWRLSAQLVSVLAMLAMVLAIYRLARTWFGERAANLSALFAVILPFPALIGHDTLADSLSLALVGWALVAGECALRRATPTASIACGTLAGLGFLARPEAVLVLVAVVAALLWKCLRDEAARRPPASEALRFWWPRFTPILLMFACCGGFMAGYAIVKGELTEKLAIRLAGGMGPAAPAQRIAPAPSADWFDPGWDFSPKEDLQRQLRATWWVASVIVANRWLEAMSYLLAPLAILGGFAAARAKSNAVFHGCSDSSLIIARRLTCCVVVVWWLVLARHLGLMGYLSDRHVLTLVLISLPWAGAGAIALNQMIARHSNPHRAARLHAAFVLTIVVCGVLAQIKSDHPSRWGHRAAGDWLRAIAQPGEAVLDTRGWAAFISGLPSYDYWHVRQAFTDSRLRFLVVGADELHAQSARGATLRDLLDRVGSLVQSFPSRQGEHGQDVLVYRLKPPRPVEEIAAWQ